MSAPATRPTGGRVRSWAATAGGVVLLFAAGAAAGAGGFWKLAPRLLAQKDDQDEKKDEKKDDGVVHFAESRWAASGLKIEPAGYGEFTERVWRTGRLTLDETRVAHVAPMTEGLVRKVETRLGSVVEAGDVLAYLDSREVGQARLELVKARLAADLARTQFEWTTAAGANAAEMVEAMAKGQPVAELEARFRNRPIGDLRQQLVSAYSKRLLAKATFAAADTPDSRGSVSQSSFIKLKADAEAAEAAFQAAVEEARYKTGQDARAAEQKYREAQTAVALNKTQLLMLGFPLPPETGKVDPVMEDPEVARYPIRAPFKGTVIAQRAVIGERAGPQSQMFKIADLSTLWLQADIPQKDVPLLRGLAGGTVRFREPDSPSAAGREAKVLNTGDVLDAATRTVALIAEVPNPDGALKAGMFVEVGFALPGKKVVQVPAGAVFRQGTQAFVFVHAGKDEFRRTDVRLGRAAWDVVEVLDGLEEGRPVVAAGGFVLKSELMRDQMVGE